MAEVTQETGNSHLPEAVADTATAEVIDTLIVEETVPVLLFTEQKVPEREYAAHGSAFEFGESIITGVMLLLFCLIGLRFGNNVKYLAAIRRDLLDVRERGNVFDDTVRETSFLWLMNILWIVSAGVLLAYAVGWYNTGRHLTEEYEPGWLQEAICIGVAAGYEILMFFAYWITGMVFSDAGHTRMWTKAFSAAQGLTGVGWFFIALLVECYPQDSGLLLLIGGGVFVLFRILFITKGTLIFFNKISSWMVFLCYLCNLEIVPLILTFAVANYVCCAT